MIDFNEETDILERLGILDSKLECPKKQFLMAKGKDISASRDANLTSTRSVIDVEDGDEWGAFSLDELSSSSDDSEFLFDRRDLNANGKIHRRVRNHRQGHVRPKCFSKIVTPNLWKLFALLSVSSFAGFSMILSHGMLSFSSTNEQISLFYLFRVCGFHAFAIWVGSILVSSVLLKTNPFCIFLTLMLIFTFICAQIRMAETLTDSKTINQSVVLILCVSQAFVEGAIQRGILLLSPLWTARFHRVLFLCFAAFAFSAGAAFHLQRIHPQNNLSVQKNISADWSFPSFYGNAIGLAKIERRHRRADFEKNKNIPSFLELDLNNTYEQHKTEFYLIDRNDTANSTYINKLEKNNESETERQQQQPFFKSKTEENAFRRKEVEQKRKKEEEEQNLKEEEEKRGKEEEPKRKEKEEAEKKDKEEKQRNEAQKRKEKEEAEKKDKEEQGRNEAQKRKEKERQKQNTRKISSSVTSTRSPPKTPSKSTLSNSQYEESMSKESSRGVFFSTSILIGLFIFILPLLFGFCCCCAIDHPICSTQYRNLEALLSPSTTHSDSLSCNMLSMVICALHSALIATLQLSLAITFFSLPFESVSFSSSSFFWVSLAFSRLIFVLRPSFACKSSSIHCLYFVSLLSCSSLHFMPLSNPFSLLFGIAFLGFSAANIPLLLYVWHCSSSHSPSFLSASGRFIAAMAFGKFVGPMVFIWLNSNGINSEGNISRSTFAIPAVFYFGFCILILSYLLFLLMLVKLRKNHRQQQISQLSVALNGDAQKNRRKAKSPKSRTKGPYKSLVSSAIGENNMNFAQSFDDSEEAKESEEDVDLEMESIGGEEESDREQRMDKKGEGVYGLV